MDEYISKQDAVDAVKHAWAKGIEPSQYIESLEPTDVAPVVHSRWIKTADGAECEKCGREAVYQIVNDHWEYEPFCPHCGAKMDEGE